MARRVPIFLMIVTILFFAGCEKKDTIELPFSAQDIESIEMYHFFIPAEANQKIISSSNDIQIIMDKINNIEVKDKDSDITSGGQVVSFRFNLKTKEHFEIVYSTEIGESGRVISSNLFNYYTLSDILSIWNECLSPIETVEEAKLPVINNY